MQIPLSEQHSDRPPYRLFQHRQVAQRLHQVGTTAKLGSLPPEYHLEDDSVIEILTNSIPYKILGLQLFWSIIVTLIAYALAPYDVSSLTTDYWTSRLVVSSSISYGVGWALFVLLGFFIREASNRYWQAQFAWTNMTATLRYIIRHMRQTTPPGTWHDGDHDRIAAHLISYPITLKMALRGEREREQIQDILSQSDLDEVIQAEEMHIHCMRVVRAYFSVVEDDAPVSFTCTTVEKTPCGNNTRYYLIKYIDAVDEYANAIMRISHFQPAKGYVNHLRIFLYIWMFFLPLALVKTSGWFTILWALLVSYSIGMLFNIARALNDPFGYDIQDIKLNRLAAESALEILNTYSRDRLELSTVIRKEHNTPPWLTQVADDESNHFKKETKKLEKNKLRSYLALFSLDKTISISLFIYILWSVFVLFLSWGLPDTNSVEKCRWWCVYIPVDKSTMSYVSLGIFLLLGFWISDAYRRYWRGLQLWQSTIRTSIEEAALHISLVAKQGTWHERDRERIFSHIAAIPFAAKLHLRENRDTKELEKILCAQDVAAFREADDFFVHGMNVVYGYLNSIDCVHAETTQVSKNPFRVSMRGTKRMLWNIELAVQECNAIHKFPLSPSFTIHLKGFTAFWLALLPLSLINFNGFLGLLYVIPIGFSILKLIIIGLDLADPFGTDEEDIPLEMFCEEIKSSLHTIYNESLYGTTAYVHKSDYRRSMFKPRMKNQIVTQQDDNGDLRRISSLVGRTKVLPDRDENSKLVNFVQNVVAYFPSVSFRGIVLITLWSVISVCTSYGFSFLWEDEKRESCTWWCSPIDVESAVLANVGFGLFMILAFRASDAIERYQTGTMLMINLEKDLRHLAVEILVFIKDGLYHENDKERIVAHIVQIPLYFRDQLLNTVREPQETEGFLSKQDRQHFESSAFPIQHLLQTIQAYVVVQDSLVREGHPEMLPYRLPTTTTNALVLRIARIREMISQVFGVKRFPVIESYTKHQHIFAALWLMLLPLAMTSSAGFFTILWAPIISYGVLALEEIAEKLVDPYGTDSIDIDVDQMCLNAANSVLEAVDNINWGCEPNIHSSNVAESPGLGVNMKGDSAFRKYDLAHFEKFDNSVEFGDDTPPQFTGLIKQRTDPKLFVHLIRSVPWRELLAVIAWTIIGTSISFLTKDKSKTARWWQSSIRLDVPVATYVSFAGFMLLGFYVQAAFTRYMSAGRVWTHDLRFACSSLAAQFMSLFPEGALHEGDHQRAVAHVAALPLVLKHELLHSRDTRELKGLLSSEDLLHIQCAESMANHCLDVIRAYYAAGSSHKDMFTKKVVMNNRASPMNLSITHIENGIALSKFLRSYEIAPGFQILLNLLLATWFLVLPFAIAERSGWFTILWVPIIAYGLLGMYTIAKELQFPFGNDLNDLRLDEMAKKIVSDVLFVRKHYQHGTVALVHPSGIGKYWTEQTLPVPQQKPRYKRQKPFTELISSIKTSVQLAKNAFSPTIFAFILAWSAFSIVAAWLVDRYFPFDKEIEKACKPWFCSRIAVDKSVKEYVGFALFFLLGFRLYDSHWRYVTALQIWEDGILGYTRLLANRILESYYGSEWHQNDKERIAAHLAAHAVAIAGQLREEDYEERFKEILSEEDTRRLLSARQRSDYCLDVVHRYLTESDWMYGMDKTHPVSRNESRMLFFNLAQLRRISLQCENMVKIPLPYGYVQHIRIFLVIWLLLLPLGLVETTGWLSILWITFIAYGVLGIEKWAEELSNPFGHDLSDIPMDDMVEKVKQVIRTNLRLYQNGAKDFIRKDRPAFPSSDRDYSDEETMKTLQEI